MLIIAQLKTSPPTNISTYSSLNMFTLLLPNFFFFTLFLPKHHYLVPPKSFDLAPSWICLPCSILNLFTFISSLTFLLHSLLNLLPQCWIFKIILPYSLLNLLLCSIHNIFFYSLLNRFIFFPPELFIVFPLKSFQLFFLPKLDLS